MVFERQDYVSLRLVPDYCRKQRARRNPFGAKVVGGAGRALIALERAAPRLVERLLPIFAFTAQQTDEAKSDNDLDNLYKPVESIDRVNGTFNRVARDDSAYTWLSMHPVTRSVIGLAALAAAAVLMGRYSKTSRPELA
jgi:hypothetical protein